LRGYVRRLGDSVRDRQATVNCRWAGGRFSRREGNRWASGRARIWVPVCALSGGTKHGVPLWGATLAPPIERRTGEASVIVAADGLTASDAVSCQLNLRAHPRPIAGYLGESARTQSSKLSIRRTGQHPADMGVGIGNGRSGPSGRSTSVATTDVRFPRPQYLRWAPLAAGPTRASYTDRTVRRHSPLSP